MLSFTAVGNFVIKQLLLIQCPYLCRTWWTEAIKMRQSSIQGAKARKKMEERQKFSSVQVAAGKRELVVVVDARTVLCSLWA